MNFLRRLRYLFCRQATEAEMAEEMRFHLDERTADNLADGLPPDEARYAAQRRFGNVASIQEQAREGRGWRWLKNFLMDLRLGVRSLWKSPGFTLTAGLTLALGIGANTAMFSVLNGIMLKPLPYAENARLESIHRVTAQDPEGEFSVADFLDLQRAAGGYGEVAAFAGGDVSLAEPGQPAELADAIRITPNFFSLLGLRPQTGRDFRADEAVPGQDRLLIISERCWHNASVAGPTSSVTLSGWTGNRTRSSACCRPRSTIGVISVGLTCSGRSLSPGTSRPTGEAKT